MDDNVKNGLRLTTAVASALILFGCNKPNDEWTAQSDTAVCRDRDGHRVPDTQCRGVGGGHGGFFTWYYLTRGGAIAAYGEQVYGGYNSPRAGAVYSAAPTSTAISRGGFGASAEAAGGHGGGAGE